VSTLDRQRFNTAVAERVVLYGGLKDEWYAQCFQPTLPRIEIAALAWEDIIARLAQHDPAAGAEIGDFYQLCLKYKCLTQSETWRFVPSAACFLPASACLPPAWSQV